MSNKKYGLILSEKGKSQQLTFQASRNVFGDDSESDDESGKKPVLLRPSDNIKRQAKIAQNKAVTEDPTVFQYDEIYDSMKTEKEGKKEKSKEEKKPKYIENLIKSANKRKIENERRVERQIQKEREKEGDEFAEKEVFVTSAYKKKLEEMSLEEEKERREEYLESIGDVTKQEDLGGFYRHLYEQKLGPDKKSENKVSYTEKHKKSALENESIANEVKISDLSKKRNYRKRKSSQDNTKQLSDGEIDDSDEEINRLNLDDIKMAKKYKLSKENIDADSDFSIDESSDEENKIEKSNKELEEEIVFKKPEPVKEKREIAVGNEDNKKNNDVKATTKPKVDIWKKRTVGEVFEQALKRYYERKAGRSV